MTYSNEKLKSDRSKNVVNRIDYKKVKIGLLRGRTDKRI